jgi:hypothetical protein
MAQTQAAPSKPTVLILETDSSQLENQPQQYAALPSVPQNGTSFAAPVITAFIQQWLEANPGKPLSEMHKALQEKFYMPAEPGFLRRCASLA